MKRYVIKDLSSNTTNVIVYLSLSEYLFLSEIFDRVNNDNHPNFKLRIEETNLKVYFENDLEQPG